MATQTPTKNVPKLRFPEFEGEWEEKKLDEVLDYKQPTKYLVESTEYSDNYKTPVLTAGKTFILGYTNETHGIFSKSLPTIIFDDFTTDFKFVDFPFKAKSSAMKMLVPKSLNVSMKYVYEAMRTIKFPLGEHKRYWISEYRYQKIPYPHPNEQQKIAGFLTAVDERIDQLRRKKDLLTQYKTGIMQQLFSQQLRFTDNHGQPFPDWEEVQFSELYDFVPTNSLSRDNLNYTDGYIFNIHYGDIHTKFEPSFHLEKESVPFINSNVDIEKYSNSYCAEGDLVIADASEDYNDIGKTVEIIGTNGSNILAGLHTIHARRISNRIIVGYAAHLMASGAVKKDIKFIAQGAKVLGISPKNIAKLEFLLPHPDEQEKIAACLSAVDDHIAHVSQQLIHTQVFKQGLLQQMFV